MTTVQLTEKEMMYIMSALSEFATHKGNHGAHTQQDEIRSLITKLEEASAATQ